MPRFGSFQAVCQYFIKRASVPEDGQRRSAATSTDTSHTTSFPHVGLMTAPNKSVQPLPQIQPTAQIVTAAQKLNIPSTACSLNQGQLPRAGSTSVRVEANTLVSNRPDIAAAQAQNASSAVLPRQTVTSSGTVTSSVVTSNTVTATAVTSSAVTSKATNTVAKAAENATQSPASTCAPAAAMMQLVSTTAQLSSAPMTSFAPSKTGATKTITVKPPQTNSGARLPQTNGTKRSETTESSDPPPATVQTAAVSAPPSEAVIQRSSPVTTTTGIRSKNRQYMFKPDFLPEEKVVCSWLAELAAQNNLVSFSYQ